MYIFIFKVQISTKVNMPKILNSDDVLLYVMILVEFSDKLRIIPLKNDTQAYQIYEQP